MLEVTAGRYLVLNRHALVVDPSPKSDLWQHQRMLLGPVLGYILHAHGFQVFHAAAVLLEHGAVLVLGRSGSGKSSVLAAFGRVGRQALTDDKAAVRVSLAKTPMLWPGPGLIRLPMRTAQHLGFCSDGLRGDAIESKMDIPVGGTPDVAVPVVGAYILDVHNKPTIELHTLDRVSGAAALFEQVYMPRALALLGRRQECFEAAGLIASHLPVTVIRHPWLVARIEELRQVIEQHAGQ